MFRQISRWILVALMAVSISPLAEANNYNIKQMTAQVSAALENRRARYDEIQRLKAQLVVGENNQGYLSVLEHDTEIVKLVKNENDDRKVIYETITAQNDLKGAIEVVEQVFARVQREKASKGHRIQLENGDWVTK